MKIYVRKVLNHDITHEVSVTTNIVNEFFDGKDSFMVCGKKSNLKGIVTINSATDPRFGGDYKNILRAEGDISEDDIILMYKNQNTYLLEILYTNDNKYEAIKEITSLDIRHSIILSDDEIDYDESVFDRVKGGFNKIYYGVPGCGKSFKVDKEFDKNEFYVERTTFHPEYTNSDFVGQIIPKLNGEKVSYEFHVGAFTKVLEYALKHPNKKTCLVIEEINRGNASAIFGDIFQLLDRDKDGASKYTIFNGPVIDYLNKVRLNVDSISIPSNMWIVATMNTSDQNVFTLDTAFKRRWKMEYIQNVFSSDPDSQALKNAKIAFNGKYNDITWGEFVSKINKHILADNSGINGEDKQLGMYFVSIEELNNEKEFAEKVLSYIWEDVAKLNTQYWFGDIESYEELLTAYEDKYLNIFDSLFEDNLKITDNIDLVSASRVDGE